MDFLKPIIHKSTSSASKDLSQGIIFFDKLFLDFQNVNSLYQSNPVFFQQSGLIKFNYFSLIPEGEPIEVRYYVDDVLFNDQISFAKLLELTPENKEAFYGMLCSEEINALGRDKVDLMMSEKSHGYLMQGNISAAMSAKKLTVAEFDYTNDQLLRAHTFDLVKVYPGDATTYCQMS